jgi:hypothetical protein
MDDSGISQSVLPGQSEGVLYADSKEYNEAGHTTESGDVRKQMMKKGRETWMESDGKWVNLKSTRGRHPETLTFDLNKKVSKGDPN